MPTAVRSRPSVAPLSVPLFSLGTPPLPPPVSWTLPLTKPRSPPQKGGMPVPPPDKTWQTLVDPPPSSGLSSPAGSSPGGPSQHYDGPPACRCMNVPISSPST